MECPICCEEIEIQGRYLCGHTACYKCVARLVFLYKTMSCPLCKSEKGNPCFEVPQETPALASLSIKKGSSLIRDSSATYANEDVRKKVKGLLALRCKKCKFAAKDNVKLIEHCKEAHGKLLCDVCVGAGRHYWFETAFYGLESLEKHKRGRLKEPGFTGHVYCTHCEVYFYGKDEAKAHCRQEHQLCTVCDILGLKFQFYKNYSDLEKHYHSKHFCCSNVLCIKNFCYVFAYKSELWTHCIQQHALDIQLTEIRHSGRANPPVCAIVDNDEAGPSDLYREERNIVTPLVDEPYFPAFGTSGGVPAFMDRQIVHQAEKSREGRLKLLRFHTRAMANEINASIEKYLDNKKEIAELASEIETAVGGQTCLQVMQDISFLQKSNEVKEFLKEYKKAVMFPTLKKEVAPAQAVVGRKKMETPFKTFKIIDTTKKK